MAARLALFFGVVTIGQLPAAATFAEELKAAPSYSYHGSKLLLLLPSPTAEETTVGWRAISVGGQPIGGQKAKRVKLRPGENRVELMVGDAGAHHLSYKQAGRLRSVWANRGIWYLGSSALRVDKTVHTRSHAGTPAVPSDRYLAGGMRAYVRGADGSSPLELGRTMGYDSDRGVKLGRLDALVLVAGGTVGPLRLTLAQVVGKEETQYWDYTLVISKKLRRYEVPLALFRQRVAGRQQLRTLFSISFRTTTPAQQGTTLEIDSLALNHSCHRLKSISRRGGRIAVALHPGGSKAKAELWLSSLQGQQQRRPFKGLSAIGHAGPAARFWICSADADGGRGCDPPDAPLTAYALPAEAGGSVLVDRFEYQAPINFARETTVAFASSVKLQQEMVAEHRSGSLLLRYHPAKTGDYAGYLTPLPARLPLGVRSVQVIARGKVPAAAVTIGLKDAAGHQPRVVLQAYARQLSESWQTVRIPLEAFNAVLAGMAGGPRRLQEPLSLTVTMGVSITPAVHEFELKEIRLIPEPSPVTVARFDGELGLYTSFGSSIALENRRGVKLEFDQQAAGKIGRALSVTVMAREPSGYGLVSFGLGRLDLSNYSQLSLWARSGTEPTRALLQLSDGKKLAKLSLAKYLKPVADWQQVNVPLDAFAGQIDRRQLRQLSIVWEDQKVYQEKLILDEITFE